MLQSRFVLSVALLVSLVQPVLAEGGPADVAVDAEWLRAVERRLAPNLPQDADWTYESDREHGGAGTAVTNAGDVNGDGYDDLLLKVLIAFSDEPDGPSMEMHLFYGSADGPSVEPDWTYTRELGFISRLAPAGDVNGDGYADILAAQVSHFNSQSQFDGLAWIFHGSAEGPSSEPDWSYAGNSPISSFADALAPAGDVNGDGYGDILIGSSGQGNLGRAMVFHGSPQGLESEPAWTRDGTAFSQFGSGGSGAGDINGDGYGDVVVGAPSFSGENIGWAMAFHGSATGLSAFPSWMAEGTQVQDQFGHDILSAGDVNGDGYADVLVSHRGGGPQRRGRAYVFHGSPEGLSPAYDWVAVPSLGETFIGLEIGLAGDVNGDGYSDVLVSVGNGETPEKARLYLGSSAGLEVAPNWVGTIAQADVAYAQALSSADLNGDGFSDVIVGASQFSNPEEQEGGVFVYYGNPSGLADAPAWNAGDGAQAEALGLVVARAGDVDGDGYTDVLVGAPDHDGTEVDEGRALLFLGGADGPALDPAWDVTGGLAGARFGSTVGGAGDVNADGYADIVIGSQVGDAGAFAAGETLVFHGSPAGPATTPDWSLAGNGSGAGFGAAAAGAGDVNGDGCADLIVGAPGEETAYVFHGSPLGLGTAGWSSTGTQAGEGWGAAVGSAGDVNGDGLSDVIVGAPDHDVGAAIAAGRAAIFLGDSTGLASSSVWDLTGSAAGARFGAAVGSAGDVNDDGYSEALVGAPAFANGATGEGQAAVFLGSPAGPSALADWTVDGDLADAALGSAVASADVNGDGYSDVVLGAPGWDDLSADPGRAFVFLGSAAGLATSGTMFGGAAGQAGFGTAAAGVGDVNGDGRADVLVGAPGCDAGAGCAFVYLGNGGDGVDVRPRQRRDDDTAPIAPLGLSPDPDRFRLAVRGRTPVGRGGVKLEWEAAPLGTPFDDANLQRGTAWIDSGVAGVQLSELATGLAGEGAVRWRLRVLHAMANSPWVRHGPWLFGAWNGLGETDLRMAVPFCGDGKIAGDEECDDGNQDAGDGCDADCVLETCGNGVVQAGEACDDGNDVEDDACDNDCTLNVCGDGVVNNDEQCDDGGLVDGDGCDAACFNEVCGNGIAQAGEACDDGNDFDTDGCGNDCVANVCGDGEANNGEACDDGNGIGGDLCENDCSPSIRLLVERGAAPGDVLLQWQGATPDYELFRSPDPTDVTAVEHRIDRSGSNLYVDTPPAGALFFYRVGTVCGNGRRDDDEACDDGNTNAYDGCRIDCTVEACGDGILEPGEACDDGNLVDGDGCQSTCAIAACGDGIVDPAEACDDANDVSGDGCRPDCTAEACGDGIVDPSEACDDGNLVDGDGCQASCDLAACGDGILDPSEECDDGNVEGLDGCTADCRDVRVCANETAGNPVSSGTIRDADASTCYLTRITLGCEGVSDGAEARLQDVNSGGRNALYVLYSTLPDGEPGALVAHTLAFRDSASNGAPVIASQPWYREPTLSAGDYWAGVCFQGSPSDYFLQSTSGGDMREERIDEWLFGPPVTWPVDTDTHTAERAMRIRITLP